MRCGRAACDLPSDGVSEAVGYRLSGWKSTPLLRSAKARWHMASAQEVAKVSYFCEYSRPCLHTMDRSQCEYTRAALECRNLLTSATPLPCSSLTSNTASGRSVPATNDLNLASDLQSPRLRTVPQGSRKVFRQGSDFPERMFQVCSYGRADEAHQ